MAGSVTGQQRPLRAVLFDLDDTLLRSDMEDEFLHRYFALLQEYARPLATPQQLMDALMGATGAMQSNRDPNRTNEQAFAAVFAPRLGRPWPELRAFFGLFYEEQFPKLCVLCEPHPDARDIVQGCLDVGYQVAIATNPLFPGRAIEHRMEWAGIRDMPFDLVTAYENMHSCKPNPAYYLEIAAQLGVSPAECLMVGNDMHHDIAPAQTAGMYTFLADEWVANDNQTQPDYRGKLAKLPRWMGETFERDDNDAGSKGIHTVVHRALWLGQDDARKGACSPTA